MNPMLLGLQGCLLLGMVLVAMMILRWHTLMASAVALAAFSLMMSLEFYLLQAPDVAIAEAGIGAGLTTAILVLGIRAVRRSPEAPDHAATDASDDAACPPDASTPSDPALPIPPVPSVPSVPDVPSSPEGTP